MELLRVKKKKETAEFIPEEIDFLRKLLETHVTYYSALAGSSRCSPENRVKYELIKGLWDKLGVLRGNEMVR